MEIGGELLAQAVLHFGLDVTSFEQLGGQEGTAVAAQREQQPVVLKLNRMEAAGQEFDRLVERTEFARYLADRQVPVAQPLPAIDGRWVVPMIVNGTHYAASLTSRAAGQHVDRGDPAVWNDDLFQQWGEIMGRTHALARQYPLWQEGGSQPTALTGWQHEHRVFSDWCQDDKVRTRWLALEEQLLQLPRDRAGYGLIHNDFHPYNFRVQQGKITLFDFDVCGFHWFAKDLAIPLFFADWQRPSNLRQPFQQYLTNFFAQFMAGYRRHNQLQSQWLEQLPLFLKHHQMLLFIVFSDVWGKAPQRWQARQLGRWRAAIVTGMPVFSFSLTAGRA